MVLNEYEKIKECINEIHKNDSVLQSKYQDVLNK